MNYFIDFEATQFSEEIISVGCVREDGETFYSLVAPVKGKITPFITNLTGITAEMLETAMTPDAVFELFYNWAFENDEVPIFFVWGDCDVNFLRHTFKRTASRQARMAIGYMCGSVKDYAKEFCKQNKLASCGLLKAYNVLIDANMEQNHNALDDAMLLAKVYEKVNSLTKAEVKDLMHKAVPEKVQQSSANKKADPTTPNWNHMGYPAGTVCVVNSKKKATMHFENAEAAAQWIMETKFTNTENVKLERIKAKVVKAYSGGQPYFNMKWRLCS